MIDTKEKLLASIAHAIKAFEHSQRVIVGASIDIPTDNGEDSQREKFFWDGEHFHIMKNRCND